MAHLAVAGEAEFNVLKEQAGATSGNLSVQITKLQEAGYIGVVKSSRNNYSLTTCQITPQGREALKLFYSDLMSYLGGV